MLPSNSHWSSYVLVTLRSMALISPAAPRLRLQDIKYAAECSQSATTHNKLRHSRSPLPKLFHFASPCRTRPGTEYPRSQTRILRQQQREKGIRNL
ncbi:hypothetical protein GGI42DRAFT_92937 [Trichoderma sp. SZMC 28013]